MTDHACAGAVCHLCDSHNVPIADRDGYRVPVPESLRGPGSARRADPDTAKDAANFIKAKATSARVVLARAFYLAGEGGLTAEEACEVANLSLSSEYATRTSELMRLGIIRATQGRRTGGQGMERQVYAITPEGRILMDTRLDA